MVQTSLFSWKKETKKKNVQNRQKDFNYDHAPEEGMKNSTANYKIMYSNRLNVKNMCSSKMINIDSFICWKSSLYQIDFTYLGLEKTFMSYFRYNIQ